MPSADDGWSPLAIAWRIARAVPGEAGAIIRGALRRALDEETGIAALRRRSRDAMIREIAGRYLGDAVGPSAAAARLVDAWSDYAARAWPRERDGTTPTERSLRADLWALCNVAPVPLSPRQVATILADGNFHPSKFPSEPGERAA